MSAKQSANDRFIEAVKPLGLTIDITRYPDGTRTAADAAAAIGCEVAAIVKSLVFMVGDEPLLILTSGANRVDTKAVGAELGTKIRQANADEVRAATGFAIGGTPPFGHPQAVRTICDADLLEFETIYAAAGTPDSCFPLTPHDLLAATSAQVIQVAGPG